MAGGFPCFQRKDEVDPHYSSLFHKRTPLLANSNNKQRSGGFFYHFNEKSVPILSSVSGSFFSKSCIKSGFELSLLVDT